MNMEEKLYEAAIRGSLQSLHEALTQNELILNEIAVRNFTTSPLHVAASMGHTEFVKELLRRSPDLAQVLDQRRRTALHLAAEKGHVEIVRALLELPDYGNEMCLVVDMDGRNPLHAAAMKGKLEVLKLLMDSTGSDVAQARVKGGHNILHLCVLYRQQKALEYLMVKCQEIINAKDDVGNTILHLAVADKQIQVVNFLVKFSSDLKNEKLDLNAKNTNGYTAMDIIRHSETKAEVQPISDILIKNKAKRAKNLIKTEWLTEKRESLMIVTVLIAAMAFQAGLSPPGGVWQDDGNGHRAGETVMAYNYQDSFPYFLRANTVGFVASLSTILLLISDLPFKKKSVMWVLVLVMWLTITSTAFTYAFSITVITPKKDRKALSRTIVVAVIVWCSVMSILLIIHSFRLTKKFFDEKHIEYEATMRLLKNGPSRLLSGIHPRCVPKGCYNV